MERLRIPASYVGAATWVSLAYGVNGAESAQLHTGRTSAPTAIEVLIADTSLSADGQVILSLTDQRDETVTLSPDASCPFFGLGTHLLPSLSPSDLRVLLAVPAPTAHAGSDRIGRIYIFDSSDGSRVTELSPPVGGFIGWGIGIESDADGDGHDDYNAIVLCPNHNGTLEPRTGVYSSATGEPILFRGFDAAELIGPHLCSGELTYYRALPLPSVVRALAGTNGLASLSTILSRTSRIVFTEGIRSAHEGAVILASEEVEQLAVELHSDIPASAIQPTTAGQFLEDWIAFWSGEANAWLNEIQRNRFWASPLGQHYEFFIPHADSTSELQLNHQGKADDVWQVHSANISKSRMPAGSSTGRSQQTVPVTLTRNL